MSFRPVLFHDLDDDGAPVDYTYVSSVNEGRRRQRAQSMHDQESPSAAVVRHRADPYGRSAVDAYGTRARRRSGEEARGTVMTKLPSAADGPAPAQSVAYPEGYAIPDNPFDPPPEAPRPVRRARPLRDPAEGETPAVSGRLQL